MTIGLQSLFVGIEIVHKEKGRGLEAGQVWILRVQRPEPGQVNIKFTETRWRLGR